MLKPEASYERIRASAPVSSGGNATKRPYGVRLSRSPEGLSRGQRAYPHVASQMPHIRKASALRAAY